MSRDMTKPIKWVCAQRRLRSAWASTQSDQSSLSAWRNLRSLATHWAHSEDSDQTVRMPRLIWVFAGRTLTLLVLSCRGWNEKLSMFAWIMRMGSYWVLKELLLKQTNTDLPIWLWHVCHNPAQYRAELSYKIDVLNTDGGSSYRNIFEPEHDKPVICAPNQTQIRLRSAWSDFVVRSRGSQRLKVSSCRQRRFWSDWGWSESLLGIQVILLILSCYG